MHHVAVKSKPYGSKSGFSGYNRNRSSSSSLPPSSSGGAHHPPAAAPVVRAPPLTLSPEQAAVFEQVKRRSCVVMGPGGCGKSHMIRYMAQWAEREGVELAVTSLTGAAALVLQVPNATTLHRWTGVGLGKQSVSETMDKIRFKSYLAARWRKTQVLVIDEVSMMSRKLFELIDGVARAMRGIYPLAECAWWPLATFTSWHRCLTMAAAAWTIPRAVSASSRLSGRSCFRPARTFS